MKAGYVAEQRAKVASERLQGNIGSVKLESVTHSDPEILRGAPVFVGTRVPVRSLFDHLEAGDSIGNFLEGFPSVRREQVITVLEESRRELLQPA